MPNRGEEMIGTNAWKLDSNHFITGELSCEVCLMAIDLVRRLILPRKLPYIMPTWMGVRANNIQIKSYVIGGQAMLSRHHIWKPLQRNVKE